MVASFNSIAGYCGVEARLPAANTSAGYEELSTYTIPRDGSWQDASAIYSAGGSEPVNNNVANLRVSVNDWRGITTGVYVDIGYSSPSTGMGVQLLPALPSGAIACVKSVSWLQRVATAPTSPATINQLPERTLIWSSYDKATLPISTLGAYPVDGFELVGNFSPASGVAYFSVSKGTVADATAIQICILPNTVSTWNCIVPNISDQTDHWVFSVGSAQPGTYMLTSTHVVAKT